jgi:hypothetical protein
MLIPEYIKKWLQIIEQMANTNTYKLAWGRAIIECITDKSYTILFNKAIINFRAIAIKIIKYYWNQTFFYNLRQSSPLDPDPVILQRIQTLIHLYIVRAETVLPAWFDVGMDLLQKTEPQIIEQTIKKICIDLTKDVSYRFKNIQGQSLDIYEYERFQKELEIKLSIDNISTITEYSTVLTDLLNYKWAQLLEKYNTHPKIIEKTKSISNNKIRRKSLSAYKDQLLREFSGNKIIDFYTGLEIVSEEISVDHVIPWSFMYSDDIWNLVLTSKSRNSSKSNNIPDKTIIDKLNKRNSMFISNNILNDTKMVATLKYANDHNLVNSYYSYFR